MDNDFLPRRRPKQPVHSRVFQPNMALPRTNDTNDQQTPVIDTPVIPEPSDNQNVTPVDVPAPQAQQPQTPSNNPFHKWSPQHLKLWLASTSKKQRILLALAATIVLAGIAFSVYYFVLRETPKTLVKRSVVKQKAVAPAKPTTVASTLTGLQVDPAINGRPVTAVMIENSQFARPQAGIIDAGVVFEAIAEGGITRFLTLFQDTEPDYIGPVRSVRPYYVQWLTGFDAAVAHVGGSAEALAMLKQPGAKDLDQFYNPAPYWRVSSREAPHNMYSSVIKLRETQVSKGWSTSTYTGFARKDREAAAAQPTARTIDFAISGPLYNAHYDYDAASNAYKRSEGGAIHTDDRSGQQIMPKVVIGLVMAQGANGIYTTYGTIGSGRAFIFQDGTVTQGNWSKTSPASQFEFKDDSGNIIKLNPGKTWLTVVGGTDRVTYQP